MTEPLPTDQRPPGFYRLRLVSGGPWIAHRIMEADGLFLLLRNGQPTSAAAHADYFAVPGMDRMIYAREISAEEYAALLAAAAEAEPGHPLADPTQAVDLRAAKSLY